MAAQDLVMTHRGRGGTPYPEGESDPGGTDGAALLLAILRKRWLLLLVITIVSGAIAFLASWQLGQTSSVIKSTLIYTGLPGGSGGGSYDPLGTATGSELMVSPRVLNQLRTKRQLDIGPVALAEAIKPTINRSSSLLNVTLNWGEPGEGIEVLNELNEIFIGEMEAQRKTILREHLQHLEASLYQMKLNADGDRQQLESLRRKQDSQLAEGGLVGDQYRQALSDAANAKKLVGGATAEENGKRDQITQVSKMYTDVSNKIDKLQQSQREHYLNEARSVLKAARSRYSPGSPPALQIEKTINNVSKLVQSDAASGFNHWLKSVSEILISDDSGLSSEDRAKLDESFKQIKEENLFELRELIAQRNKAEEQKSQLELSLIPIKTSKSLLETNLSDAEKHSKELRKQLTGITATQLDDFEHRVEESERQQDAVIVQRDNLKQLTDGKLREWAVSVPASLETTLVGSNHKKLFVFLFGACSLLFSAPLFATEWRAQTGSPQMRFARSLRVPLLAERILEHYSPKQRRNSTHSVLTHEQLESVRMMTLKIQQSCHRPGSVVLFSSLDSSVSAGPLMATVAECLAEREERVLLIDAVCPERAVAPVMNLLTSQPDSDANGRQKTHLPVPVNGLGPGHSDHPGLSEFLTEDCEAVSDLIRPTGCPGVDVISSGRNRFAREAMASSCLTELLNTCRRNYTMVLVHGPAADRAADLQMLTARADGVVLAATPTIARKPVVRELVQDLLDLGAPIIGVVA